MKIKKWIQNGKLQIDQIKQLVFKIYLSFFSVECTKSLLPFCIVHRLTPTPPHATIMLSREYVFTSKNTEFL